MPHNFLIGIGGTGARAIEAMVQLCAAGYGPDQLSLFIVDPDEGNGNLDRTKTLITLYRDCKKHFIPTPAIAGQMFKSNIKVPQTLVWKIFDEKNATLSKYIKYDTLSNELKDLASILFSEPELHTGLNEGFRGHPSIGSVVMSNPPEDEDPWEMLWEEVADKKENDVRIFLIGSAFGGTGAAGVPTFGSRDLIKFNPKASIGSNASRVLLGGALVLPYFSFEKKDTEEEMYVTKDDFPIATKAALQYYNEKELGFDQLYFIGDSLNQKVGKFSHGSHSQENNPHYIEIVTALAATDFFEQPSIEGEPEKLYFIASREDEKIIWDSLPVSRNSHLITKKLADLKTRLVTMATFAYAFCTYGRYILEKDHEDIDEPWYRDFFNFKPRKEKDRIKNPRLGDNKVHIDNFNKFLKHFLAWFCCIDDEDKIALFNRKNLCKGSLKIGKEINLLDFEENKIGDILKEKSKKENFGFFINKALNMVDISSEKTLSAANKYIDIFYEAAMKFCAHNYNIH